MKQIPLKCSFYIKSYSQNSEQMSFLTCFKSDLSTFELRLLPNYCELFNYPWLTYVRLIIRARDQNLSMDTKWSFYSCPSFNFACTTSIVKSLKRQMFCKLINLESTHTTHKHASKCKHGACLKKWLLHF